MRRRFFSSLLWVRGLPPPRRQSLLRSQARCTGDDLGNFRVWSAALASVRLASPEARQTPTARGARAPWAAPYAPARLSEIGISSEEGDCRLAPTGTAC